MKDEKIKIEYVSIESLHPNPKNPRTWSEKAKKDLKASLKKFGLTEPLIVNSHKKHSGRIVSGHFRWTMAKELGFKTVPVVFLEMANEEKEEELLLRMNANSGDWSYELLRAFEIDQLLEVGFDDTDLSNIWDEALETEDDDFNVGKELKKIKKPKAKLGELYALGEHRIICGDSLDPKVVEKLVGKEKISMVFSDPIYNIGLDYDTGVGGKAGYGGKTNDSKPDAEYKKFLKTSLENILPFTKKDLHVFYWCDSSYIGMVQEIYRELGIKNRRVCLWVKNGQNPTPHIAFSKAYESAVYGTVSKPYISPTFQNLNEIMNKEMGTGNQLIHDIYDTWDVWLVKRIAGQAYEHSTQKPVTLYEKAIKRCTKLGDIVFDSFGGSGSNLIACEQMKRRCLMVEIEPVFIDLIIRRYEKLTGKKAKKLN